MVLPNGLEIPKHENNSPKGVIFQKPQAHINLQTHLRVLFGNKDSPSLHVCYV